MVGYIAISLWIVATLLEAGALVALFRRKIVRRNLALVIFFGVGIAWAVLGFRQMWRGSLIYRDIWPHLGPWMETHLRGLVGWVDYQRIGLIDGQVFPLYYVFWYKARWLTYPLHAILALGAVHRLARCFPGVYQLSRIMLIFFGGFAGLGMLVSMGLAPNDPMMLQAALYCARHSEAFWLCFIFAAVLFFAQFGGKGGVAACPNAQNGAAVAILYFLVTFAAGTMIASRGQAASAGQIGLQVGVGGCFLAWWVLMTAKGEIIPPTAAPSTEEIFEADQERDQLRRKLKDEGLFVIDVR